jgi:hypothetical protein
VARVTKDFRSKSDGQTFPPRRRRPSEQASSPFWSPERAFDPVRRTREDHAELLPPPTVYRARINTNFNLEKFAGRDDDDTDNEHAWTRKDLQRTFLFGIRNWIPVTVVSDNREGRDSSREIHYLAGTTPPAGGMSQIQASPLSSPAARSQRSTHLSPATPPTQTKHGHHLRFAASGLIAASSSESDSPRQPSPSSSNATRFAPLSPEMMVVPTEDETRRFLQTMSGKCDFMMGTLTSIRPSAESESSKGKQITFQCELKHPQTRGFSSLPIRKAGQASAKKRRKATSKLYDPCLDFN